jgi:hypothetical protein
VPALRAASRTWSPRPESNEMLILSTFMLSFYHAASHHGSSYLGSSYCGKKKVRIVAGPPLARER